METKTRKVGTALFILSVGFSEKNKSSRSIKEKQKLCYVYKLPVTIEYVVARKVGVV